MIYLCYHNNYSLPSVTPSPKIFTSSTDSSGRKRGPGRPPNIHRRSFEEICREGTEGYVLDYEVGLKIGEQVTVKSAAPKVIKCVKNCIFELEKKQRNMELDKLYIGKTHVPEMEKWKNVLGSVETDGVVSRYGVHRKGGYGGLIVLATMDESSIPNECKRCECILTPEEYALVVEKRVIKYFMDSDKRTANPSLAPGNLSVDEYRTQGIYVAFRMKSKDVFKKESITL